MTNKAYTASVIRGMHVIEGLKESLSVLYPKPSSSSNHDALIPN